MTDIQQVVEILQTFGMWLIGFALFFNERKSHDETRSRYNTDLREIAGMSPRLQRLDDKYNLSDNQPAPPK